MSETLLVLGAGRSQVYSIRTAQDLGIRVVAIDQNPDAPGFEYADVAEEIDFTDIERVLEYAIEQDIDGILPAGDISLPTVGVVSEELGLPGLGKQTARLATTKEKYRERFIQHDVPYPESATASTVDKAVAVAEEIGFPVILKPSLSYGGSRGVVRVDGPDSLRARFDHAIGATEDEVVLVEKFYEGREHTIESLVIDGETTVLATSDKTRTTEPYCVAKSLDYPSAESESVRREMHQVADAAATALGLENCATHIEVITTDDGPKLIDFGARGGGAGFIPSVIVPHVSGVDMTHEMIRIALGRAPTEFDSITRRGAVFRFFTPPPGEVVAVEGIESVRDRDDIAHFDLQISVGDTVPELTTQLDRIGSFVVFGTDGEDALRKAREIQETVQIKTV